MAEKARHNSVKKKITYFVLYPFIAALSSPPLLCPLWVGGRGLMLLNPLAILLATFCLRPDDGR